MQIIKWMSKSSVAIYSETGQSIIRYAVGCNSHGLGIVLLRFEVYFCQQ